MHDEDHHHHHLDVLLSPPDAELERSCQTFVRICSLLLCLFPPLPYPGVRLAPSHPTSRRCWPQRSLPRAELYVERERERERERFQFLDCMTSTTTTLMSCSLRQMLSLSALVRRSCAFVRFCCVFFPLCPTLVSGLHRRIPRLLPLVLHAVGRLRELCRCCVRELLRVFPGNLPRAFVCLTREEQI